MITDFIPPGPPRSNDEAELGAFLLLCAIGAIVIVLALVFNAVGALLDAVLDRFHCSQRANSRGGR